MKLILVHTLSIVILLLGGCSEESTPVPQATNVVTADANAEQSVEIGCASCIYKIDGVEGCVAAVKIGSQPLLVQGTQIDAHALGLCTQAKQALVVGNVEGDKFVASKINLQ